MNRAGAHAGAIGRRTARRAIGWTPLLPLAESGPSGGSAFTHSAGARSGELPCRVFQGHIVGRDLDRRPTSQGSADLALFGFRVPTGFHVLAAGGPLLQPLANVGAVQCVLLGVLSGRLGRRFGRAAGLRDSTRERRNRQGRNSQLTSTVQLTAQRERELKRQRENIQNLEV